MGKLRVEPKLKAMDASTYRDYVELLDSARKMAIDSHLFYDLDADEDQSKTKRDMQYVADKEEIGLKIRRVRGKSTLQLIFTSGSAPASTKRRRTSASEAQLMILEALRNGSGPMKRRDIVKETGISLPSWNIQIRSLLEQNLVSKTGVKSDTIYSLV